MTAKPGQSRVEFPQRMWIFKYTNEGIEYIEADREKFGQKEEQQYLSLQEHEHLASLAAARSRAEAIHEIHTLFITTGPSTAHIKEYAKTHLEKAVAEMDALASRPEAQRTGEGEK